MCSAFYSFFFFFFGEEKCVYAVPSDRTGRLWDSARRYAAIVSLFTKKPPLSQSGSGFAGDAPMRLFNILRSIPRPRGEEPLSLCLR